MTFTQSLSLSVGPLVAAGAFLTAGFVVTRLALRDRPVGRFLCQLASFIGFTTMLLVAGVIPYQPTPTMDRTLSYMIVSGFKVIWWISASWLLVGFLRAALDFKRQPRETRFIQDLIAGLIYVSAFLAIIADVFDTPVQGLLAASGVLAIVLGLALQSTLSDVFSGVVLNLSRSYRPGDWLILEGGLQGRVIETNWRATQILTEDHDLATVPNSVIAKTKLINASKPTKAHGLTIVVRLDPALSPSRCHAPLEMALLSCKRILSTPAPTVVIRSVDAFAVEFALRFFVTTFDEWPKAQNELFDHVFRHCASAGLRPAPPSGSSVTLTPRDTRQFARDAPRLLVEQLPIFATLSQAECISLAAKMRRQTHAVKDVLVEQGTIPKALFILASGVLGAFQGRGKEETEVLRLAPGDCFGQSSVLTGATARFSVRALTDVTVYEISKSDLAPTLIERPAIASELGQILARREAVGEALLDEITDHETRDESLAARLAERVKTLFGLA